MKHVRLCLGFFLSFFYFLVAIGVVTISSRKGKLSYIAQIFLNEENFSNPKQIPSRTFSADLERNSSAYPIDTTCLILCLENTCKDKFTEQKKFGAHTHTRTHKCNLQLLYLNNLLSYTEFLLRQGKSIDKSCLSYHNG